MVSSPSRFVLSVFLLFLFAFPAHAAGQRVAMVVGNSAYQTTAALPNTLNDAMAVAESLSRLGFEVITAYDAPQAELLETLNTFSDALRGAEAAVFFYAGHGMQLGTENYILPVDIKVENELSIRYGALSLSDVLRDVESKSQVAIVILDACRDNPFAEALAAADPTRSLGTERGLARMSPKGNGTIIAYAAAPGEVASDGADGHSPFTGALLEEMEKPGVEVGLLFRRVAGKVIEETGGTQRPELLVRLAAEYYLAEIPPEPIRVAENTPITEMMAPVDVTPPALPQVSGQPLRQAETEEASPEDRSALWGYTANLVESPFAVPSVQWEPPAREMIAEAEPNSTFGTAQEVGVNDEVSIAFAPQGDNDWLRFSVQQAGVLTLHAPIVPAEIDATVRLISANYDELVYWQTAARPGGELLASFEIARPGTYYLQLADSNNDKWSPEVFPVNLTYAVSVDAYEPNNGIHQATHVPLDGMFPINILPRGDRDWYKFTAEVPGSLFVNLSGAPETIDGAFRLLNSDGNEQVYWTVAPRPGGDAVNVLDLPRPGVYYLEVADNNNDGSSDKPLTMMTRFAPSTDAFEPNDTMFQAFKVDETSSREMAIFPKGDNDWLELDIVQPGELKFAITNSPENLDLTYRVVDAGGYEAQYWTMAPRPGGDVSGIFDVAKPGRYFLQVVDNNNDAASIEPFTFDIAFTASLDAYEPNDGIGSARPLTAGGEVPFTILPRGDTDWFRVSVDQPGELAISIDEGPANLDLTYRVVGADWNELAYWVPPYAKGGLTEGSVDLAAAGTYFIQIVDGSNDDRSIEPATLKTVFTPTQGSNEPNNLFGDATQVALDGETFAHILPRSDADWHVFHAPGPGRLDVTIDEVPENLDVSFRVLNADQAEIQYWIAAPRPGGVTTGTIAIPAAGWYWMEIRDGNNDARSPKPFRVTRVFTGG